MKTCGFVNERNQIIYVRRIEGDMIEGLKLAAVDVEKNGIFITGEKVKTLSDKNVIEPYEGIYIHFDLQELITTFDNNNEIYCFFSDFQRTHKKKLDKKSMGYLKSHFLMNH